MMKSSVGGWLERSVWAATHAAIILTLLSLSAFPAEARRYHHRHGYHHNASVRHASHHVRFKRHGGHHSLRHSTGGGPAFAAIVVDANTGRLLYGRSEHELRHPASVTKVMTLYLLFEQLEKGRLQLDSPLMISAHAAAQAPSKLGLAPGQTIDVENAIKAVVTKSANDIAVAIAENIGGDEDSFAQMMTRKAHALGMSRTHYANASGLPNDEQITTAHDLTILGRAIQDRFPRYYRYFATHSFTYRGHAHRNHNHLLGQVEGVDGIKTGYTRASGFNLLTSVKRGGRHIVAVVLGGRTGAARDRAMAGLIAEHIGEAGPVRLAHAITESAPAESAPAPIARIETKQDEDEEMAPPTPARFSASTPLALAPVAPPASNSDRADKIRPAFVPGGQKHVEEPVERKTRASAREAIRASADGSTTRLGAHSQSSGAATTPSALRKPNGEATKTLVAKLESGKSDVQKNETARPAHPGWMIQVGATDDADKAHELLSRARARGVPATAKAFTEKVHNGKETLWRARFAGLEEKSAEAACKSLKRSGFSCFATKN